jgi:acetaldehyde dehydrogenase
MTTNVAVIGSGNIGTDLMMKVEHLSRVLDVIAMVGIDPHSDGLARARRMSVRAVDNGVRGLVGTPEFDDVQILFDATSAAAHVENDALLRDTGVRMVDLTPAALGPFVVPPVNLGEHLAARNVNMVTCGGQATIPIVAAVGAVTDVYYAEIVASIASRSAGPGTRANIDEFTVTTARAIEQVGGARQGKAIIVLNPAEPPFIMRDTVLCVVEQCDEAAVTASIESYVAQVQTYVPGYRLKQDVQFRRFAPTDPEGRLMASSPTRDGVVVSVFLEVEGAGHYLPAYAGNLDIMTSAALQVGERLALAGQSRTRQAGAAS